MQRGYFEVKNVPNVNPESILNDSPIPQDKIQIDGVTQTLGTGPDSIKIIKNFVFKKCHQGKKDRSVLFLCVISLFENGIKPKSLKFFLNKKL